ncbi:hypothetical protein [Nocardioides sp. Kera G14]|uniref:hypothetical protein n=1 Tax=Nocardioides sp. Kera G14 TaxID=2884264 RepID=UPI001D122543|nr:hypothetical protein [Nocardioides sp. Kera G14]UDY22351.1 hypothetical protein LH076_09680 [Nocardioides sp. Kera G14]
MTLWYLIRALGFVALLALTASTALGALATRGGAGQSRLIRQLVHRSVGVLGLVVLGLHIAATLADAYVSVPATTLLFPFAAGYRPVAVALGVFALYAFILTGLSGGLRHRLAGSARAARTWRIVHTSAYLGWALSMAHGIFGGTDTRTWWGAATYVLCGATVVTAAALRLGAPPRRIPDTTGRLRLDHHQPIGALR